MGGFASDVVCFSDPYISLIPGGRILIFLSFAFPVQRSTQLRVERRDEFGSLLTAIDQAQSPHGLTVNKELCFRPGSSRTMPNLPTLTI